MFGLFQTDIPIGRRLWVMILVFILAGSSSGVINSYSQDPVRFALDILIYFGFVSVFSFVLALVPGLIGQAIERTIDKKRDEEKSYQSVVKPQRSEIWFDILVNLSFVVATYISTSNLGNPNIFDIGAIGLFLIVLTEIIDTDLLYRKSLEILELRDGTKGKLIARIVSENGEKEFTIKSEFVAETRQILDYGWQVVDITKSREKSKALFQRYIQIYRLEKKRPHQQEKETKIRK